MFAETPNLRILFVVPYPSAGPSNRFRVEQYLPYFKRVGIDYCLRPFFSKGFYRILYKRGYFLRKFLFFVFLTMRRLCDTLSLRNYDIVFIHREAFPFGSFTERIFRTFAKRIIYDFDDALFLPNVSDSNRLVGVFKNTSKAGELIQMSDYVIAGNNFLRDYALKFNRNVCVIPTPIDTDKYRPLEERRKGREIYFGWIGSSTTIKYLEMLVPALEALFEKYNNVIFSIIGGQWQRMPSPRVLCKEWSLDTEISDLQLFDIGVMPLKDDDWSRGKCAFKIIEYMAVGIPVVASSVGMNTEIIQDGINGFLANTTEEWLEKLSLLTEDAGLRRAMGEAGRRTVEEKYSLKVWAPRFLEVINKAR